MGKDRVQRLVQVIKKIPLFDNLSPSQLQAVLGACTPQRFEEGDVLCAAGTPGEELLILLTGEAAVFAEDETQLATIQPIATIGEMSIATKQIHTSTVKATQTTNVLLIKRMALDMALKTDADAQAKLFRKVVEILARRMEQEGDRQREDTSDKDKLQQMAQLQQTRADTALGLLARKVGIPLSEARELLDGELDAADIDRRVLVVDDEEHVRQMLAKILGHYDVTAVSSGAEAVEMCMESRPDLVIADISMPGMDGFQLLEKLREFHPDLPVLALSGYVKHEEVKGHDFDGFLPKPMDLTQLKSVVASALVAGSSA